MGWSGARGSQWETNGHPYMASEFLLDILRLCLLPQHQSLTDYLWLLERWESILHWWDQLALCLLLPQWKLGTVWTWPFLFH